jgi:hypothetical protein
MPRFFFNLSSQDHVSKDEIGTEFSSLEAAYLNTCDAILDIAFEKLRARQDPAKDKFEITDEQEHVLMEVPFSEVLGPKALAEPVRWEMSLTFNNCQLRAARCAALQADIRAEFEQAKNTFSDIRTTLARILSGSSR